jgi:hypothetical protein
MGFAASAAIFAQFPARLGAADAGDRPRADGRASPLFFLMIVNGKASIVSR